MTRSKRRPCSGADRALALLLATICWLAGACTAPSAVVSPPAQPTLAPLGIPALPQTPAEPAQIYQRIAPAIAFIETDWGTGSGFLVDMGSQQYVVTNSHVVRPFAAARVVFPNGLELLDTPLVDWDLIADLAVLGPVTTTIPSLSITEGQRQPVGAYVYLVGYPGESEAMPQPTLARGLISNVRQWKNAELTYYQTDASTVGGQSGGVLVSADGQIIGIPTFWFGEPGAFGLALLTADAWPRLQRLVAGEDVDGLGQRRALLDDATERITLAVGDVVAGNIDYANDVDIFLIELQEGQRIAVLVESMGLDPMVSMGSTKASEAELEFDDDSGRGIFGTDAKLAFEAAEAGNYMIIVQNNTPETGAYLISIQETPGTEPEAESSGP